MTLMTNDLHDTRLVELARLAEREQLRRSQSTKSLSFYRALLNVCIADRILKNRAIIKYCIFSAEFRFILRKNL